VGKAISTALGLAAVMIMTRSLGVEKFGWYATTVGFLQFVGILSDFSFMLNTGNMLSEPDLINKNCLITYLLGALSPPEFLTAWLRSPSCFSPTPRQ